MYFVYSWVYLSTGVSIPFSVWNTGEPNNTDGSEDCVEISNYAGYSNWNDVNCDLESKFICEIKIG